MTVRELLLLLNGIHQDCSVVIEGPDIFLLGPGKSFPGARIHFAKKELQDLTTDVPRIKHVDGTWEDDVA